MGIFSIFGESNTLYFPGCVTYFKYQENFNLYKKIFSKLGIKFKIIDKKVCCGLPALEAGYEQESRKLARRNFEIFKEEGIKQIITNSPCCCKMFLRDYPEMLPDWNIEILNLWAIVLNKLESKPWLIKERSDEVITYHDSCYLGRYCGIYDSPRKILELVGYKIKEMLDSKKESVCCGSCGGLHRIDSELADKIAKQRLLQAKRIGIKKMIVSSLNNYQLLKKNSNETEIEVLELLDVLAYALGIKVREEKINEEELTKEEQIILDIKADKRIKEELKNEEYGEENKL